ncbi:hypothetical protein [Morganella morganii]|uniref:hypothetical protein n=1 Tax=Morganella morganii TaxID=582 RepID=UPI0018999F3E|nr:hypothetical protein [Morganella morganii]
MQMSDCNAPVRARQVTEPYRRILKTPGYAGGYLLLFSLKRLSKSLQNDLAKWCEICTVSEVFKIQMSEAISNRDGFKGQVEINMSLKVVKITYPLHPP